MSDQETYSEITISFKVIYLNENKINLSLTKTGRKKVEWTKKRIIMVVLFSLIVLISIAILIVTFIDKTFLFNTVLNYFIFPLESIKYWSILLFLIFMIIQSLIVPIPSELVLLAGGMLYGSWLGPGGVWLGISVGVVGSVLSGIVTYFLANRGGRPILEVTGEHSKIADRFVLAMDLWIEKWGIWAIIVGRAVPVVMFDPISYAAGISNIKWKMYTFATFIGSIPRSIFYAIIGYQMVSGPDAIDIHDLTPEQLKVAAGNFNLIFYIIFSVLILMFIVATIVSSRIQKKRMAVSIIENKDDENTIINNTAEVSYKKKNTKDLS